MPDFQIVAHDRLQDGCISCLARSPTTPGSNRIPTGKSTSAQEEPAMSGDTSHLEKGPYHFLVSGIGAGLEVAEPVPPHFGQVTNPLRLLWAQTLHVPMTTQDSLRASPVPLHAGHATSRFPPQRGHSTLSSPTGIPPFSPNRSSTEIRNAQSAVSEDRLYVILAMSTTPPSLGPPRALLHR